MATLDASDAQCAIRASRALRARRDYGLANGDAAAFHQWMAWKHGEGPTRRGLEPLAVVDQVLWAALFEMEGGAACTE